MVFYKYFDSFHCIKYIDGIKSDLIILEKIREEKMNQYEYLPKHVRDKTIENLYKYVDDIIVWREELLNIKCLFVPFDYFDNSYKLNDEVFYRNHSNNVKTFMKRFMPYIETSDGKKQLICNTYDNIEIYEENYYLKTNRSGLMYGETGVYEMTTYDFKFYYLSCMCYKSNDKLKMTYQIPTKKGIISEIKSLPTKTQLKFGIYHVKITSNDENFNKIFGFSKENHYTHYSLNFVLYYNLNGGKITLELLSDKFLYYPKECLVDGYDLFNSCHHRLREVKKELPKNGLVKKLGSTPWGEFQSQHTIFKLEDELENDDSVLTLHFDQIKDETTYYIKDVITNKKGENIYKLLPLKQPIYQYQLRMKAFITDFARVRMARTILRGGHINDVVRVQTDSVSYINLPIGIDNPVLHNEIDLIIDKGKTGLKEILNTRRMKDCDELFNTDNDEYW